MSNNKSSNFKVTRYITAMIILWSLLSLVFLVLNWNSGRAISHNGSLNTVVSHGFGALTGMWLVGLAGIGVISYELRQRLSEQNETTQTLRRSGARYRQVFEINKSVKLILNPATAKIVDVNAAACAYYGYSHAELTSMLITEINMLSEEDVRRRAETAVSKEKLYFEFKHRLASGEIRDVEVYASPIEGDNGEQLIYAIVHDVTQRKEAEAGLCQLVEELENRVSRRTDALQQAMRKSEQANRAKGVFLANMSHELRTPLNAILAYAQIMQRDEVVSDRQGESILAIEQASTHLLGLITEILELSKIEEQMVSLSEDEFDIYEQCATLQRMFSARLRNKPVSLLVEIAPDVPPRLQADGHKLRQILINLIGNAIKFTEEGDITLRITADTVVDNEPFILHLEVEDCGVGILPEEMDSLFVPFMQTSSGLNAQSGTGLGLSISHQYVKLMGGELTAVSQPNVSTIFKFNVVVTAVTTPSPPPQIVPEEKIISLASDQSEIRLLVAEDNEANRVALVDLLERAGFAVHGVENGKEAVTEWACWRPHLIWMDMRMPIMDGRDAVKQIRSTPDGQDVIIIALTGDALLDIEELTADGYNDHLFKPFQLDDMLIKVEQHLSVTYTRAP